MGKVDSALTLGAGLISCTGRGGLTASICRAGCGVRRSVLKWVFLSRGWGSRPRLSGSSAERLRSCPMGGTLISWSRSLAARARPFWAGTKIRAARVGLRAIAVRTRQAALAVNTPEEQ